MTSEHCPRGIEQQLHSAILVLGWDCWPGSTTLKYNSPAQSRLSTYRILLSGSCWNLGKCAPKYAMRTWARYHCSKACISSNIQYTNDLCDTLFIITRYDALTQFSCTSLPFFPTGTLECGIALRSESSDCSPVLPLLSSSADTKLCGGGLEVCKARLSNRLIYFMTVLKCYVVYSW